MLLESFVRLLPSVVALRFSLFKLLSHFFDTANVTDVNSGFEPHTYLTCTVCACAGFVSQNSVIWVSSGGRWLPAEREEAEGGREQKQAGADI